MGRTHRLLTGTIAGACLLTAIAAHGQERIVDDGRGGSGGSFDGQLVVDEGSGGSGGTIGTLDQKVSEEEDDGRTIGDLKGVVEGPQAIEYFDQTPICNYLDRGIDDQSPNKRDWHVVMPPGVQTLADIDHVAFGLDLPATRCQDNPRTLPCSDDTDPRSWCVRRVELQVMGLKLLDMSGPTDGCLLTAHGGEGDAGIIGINNSLLRLNNPLWGISEDELDLLINSVDLGIGADGTPVPAFRPPQITFTGEFISRSVESVVGNFFTRDAIGCANDLYCGHRRMLDADDGGEMPLMPLLRWANASEVDCDLGNCSSAGSRRSNPWLELAGAEVGDAIHLTFDLDFAADRSGIDLEDCATKDQTDPWDISCGTNYTMVARGSIQTTAALECRAMASIPQARLPYCAHADEGQRCFQPSIMGTWGTISCPAGDDWEHCGASGDLGRISFDQRMSVVDFEVDLEDGWVVNAGDFLCTLFGCDLDDLVEGFMAPVVGRLEAGLVAVPLFTDLDGCPAVAVDPDGTLTINPQQLDNCPAGINNPDCDQLVVGGGGGGLEVMGADDFANPEEGGDEADPYGHFNFQVDWGNGEAAGYVVGAPITEPLAQRDGDGAIDQLVADTPKIPMDVLDDALVNLCALRASCDPALDLRTLPLREMATLNPASLQGLDADPEAAMAAFDFLAQSDAFRQGCLEWADPSYDGSSAPANGLEDLAFLLALQNWYTERFAVALDGPAPGEADPIKAALPDCREITPGIESVIPALGMTLTVTTGDGSVTDRFAFVNFKKATDVTDADRAVAGCGFRAAVGLPPADAPKCGDNGEIAEGPGEGWGIECGRVAGGPCADITAEYYWGGFPFGPLTNDPAHETLHPNGNYSWSHRCAEHHENGEPMVCVADFYPGAGPNTWPTCKICGTPPEGEDPDLYTMIGCEPEGAECPQGLARGLDGKCWDVTEGRPEWECAADCDGLYGDSGYCLHSGNWLDYMRNHSAIVGGVADGEGPPHQQPICADWFCPDSGIRCGWQGEACFNGESCVIECITDADCQTVANDAPAYPAGFVCGPENTCVLP